MPSTLICVVNIDQHEDPRHLRPLPRRRRGTRRRRRSALRGAGGAALAAQESLDAVGFYERPMLKFDRILTTALRAFPRSWRMFPKAMKNALGEKVWVRGIIASHLGIPSKKILFTEHHQSHAAAAFLTAPTRRAAILTSDGVGEWATMTAGLGERAPDGKTSITLLREIRFPHSLGMLYSTFTAYLGFKVNEDEYKVMGLAGYGSPSLVDEVRRTIRRTPDGAFELDLDYFGFHR